ncbi:hypothetical protein SUDANB108_07123 [Streptomyces sp. enrichment culture]|uniref:DEAD/DEAH box helicase family protein n=1 Tax=Streptomyces sp. enrichment culture TaxID=1795815 RepID=UPI003F56CDF4
MQTLRAHQREAVDAVLRALEVPITCTVPERGLRTQVIMATGTGKTLVATRTAKELRAGRVLGSVFKRILPRAGMTRD